MFCPEYDTKMLLPASFKHNIMTNLTVKSNNFLYKDRASDENIFSALVAPRNALLENLYCNHLNSCCQSLHKSLFSFAVSVYHVVFGFCPRASWVPPNQIEGYSYFGWCGYRCWATLTWFESLQQVVDRPGFGYRRPKFTERHELPIA